MSSIELIAIELIGFPHTHLVTEVFCDDYWVVRTEEKHSLSYATVSKSDCQLIALGAMIAYYKLKT